jgi:signal transduction histidine kinase
MGKKIKLLIIDDEEIVIKSCLKILKNENYDIDTAVSGDDGLKRAKEKEYDIVITDLKMPGISGMQVLETLVATQPKVTVIIFTGYATVENTREALKSGAFDYIPKPFTNEEFRNVVRNAVNSREEGKFSKMLDLMAIVSHELKSPISTVHTTAETLYKGYLGKLEPDQQKTIESILRNCQYLEDIIRNYLDLSKMDLDNLESFNKKVDLVNDVVLRVIGIPEYSGNLKQMEIVADFKVKPVINGDPNLLEIVVTNLINNAIKYGIPNTKIKISIYEESNNYIFSVFNEGVGICGDDINLRLFKKFTRLKQKGTEGIKGSGLGLYMCKTIIEKHNGKIWAESEPGKNITFFFSIPKI